MRAQVLCTAAVECPPLWPFGRSGLGASRVVHPQQALDLLEYSPVLPAGSWCTYRWGCLPPTVPLVVRSECHGDRSLGFPTRREMSFAVPRMKIYFWRKKKPWYSGLEIWTLWMRADLDHVSSYTTFSIYLFSNVQKIAAHYLY